MALVSVIVIDFGSQFTQLIARRIRSMNVYSTVVGYRHFLSSHLEGVSSIILSGGDLSLSMDDDLHGFMDKIIALGIPILGICYGYHLLCDYFGGEVYKQYKSEYGFSSVTFIKDSPIMPVEKESVKKVWTSHSDSVYKIPDNFEVLAKGMDDSFEVICHKSKNIYGVQYHPEVSHTEGGFSLLYNFLSISKCKNDWVVDEYIDSAKKYIRETVGDKTVLAAISGGVDSTVASKLLVDTLGREKVKCFFIDTGLNRNGDAENVKKCFGSLGIPVDLFDESDKFLASLKGIEDPEKKRKIVGNKFIEVFESRCPDSVDFLMQGTLYSDVIESGQVSSSAKIKSHHNVGGLPDKMKLKLVEPLRHLFKDEVRNMGVELGIDKSILNRHPFPGPGLAVRVLGEIDEESLKMLREADDIYMNLLHSSGLYEKIWQAFAVLLPVKSVGVMGDGRTYGRVCALRAISSEDGMTAEVFPYSHPEYTEKFMQVIKQAASSIVNSVPGINRVVFDITSKPPATIEWC